MSGNNETGSLSVGERIRRIEDRQEVHERECKEERRIMWKELGNLRDKVTANSTRVIITCAILAAIGSGAMSLLVKLAFK